MPENNELEPESPREAGVVEQEPRVEDVEPARLLENEVRDRLRAEGFDERQTLKWVEAYFASHTEGDADDAIAWIREQQRQSA